MKRVSQSEAWTGVANCKHCPIRETALFAGLQEKDFDSIHRPIDQHIYPAGATIYDAGEPATALFTIRSGIVKLVQFLPDGTQRIVRLLRTADLVGLEAIIGETYQHKVVALQPTEVCRLPVDVVRRLSQTNEALYKELMARWHRALSDADRWITEFSTGPARHRVVRLLLWLSEFNDNNCCELFSREDLGAVLGLTTETSSRVMAEFKRKNLILETRQNVFQCNTSELERQLDL